MSAHCDRPFRECGNPGFLSILDLLALQPETDQPEAEAQVAGLAGMTRPCNSRFSSDHCETIHYSS
jgi:hypothetical protein